jgi:methylated-DNA-[protein]-cysteine S-methyltransferase
MVGPMAQRRRDGAWDNRAPGWPLGDAPLAAGFQARFPTPFAVLGVRTAGAWLTHMEYLPRGVATLDAMNPLAAEVCRQVECYLADPSFHFDLPCLIQGTLFQQKVWREIAKIASGRTATYVDIARRIGSAPRPVGGACGANRIPLVIPCHRVVAVGGLGGFMGARAGAPLHIKQWLLRHEGA